MAKVDEAVDKLFKLEEEVDGIPVKIEGRLKQLDDGLGICSIQV